MAYQIPSHHQRPRKPNTKSHLNHSPTSLNHQHSEPPTIKMPTQSGITISAPNAPYTVVNDIEQPTPCSKQALVKTLYVGLNPV